MELDEFKALYQARFDQVPQKTGPDLEEILRQRSHTAIERIARNLLLEVGYALVIVLVLAFFMVTSSSTIFRWVSIGLVFLSIIQVVTFIWQYRQLSTRLYRPAESVRDHLLEMVAIVNRFVTIYYRCCMVMIPISAVLGGYIGFTADRTDPAFAALPEKPTIVFALVSVILAIAGIVGVYFMLKWYIHRLYGRYLDELNGCLRDLNELAV